MLSSNDFKLVRVRLICRRNHPDADRSPICHVHRSEDDQLAFEYFADEDL